MYKGNFFTEGIFRKLNLTSEEKAEIIDKDNYRSTTDNRVMEFLRSAVLMVRYQDLDLYIFTLRGKL